MVVFGAVFVGGLSIRPAVWAIRFGNPYSGLVKSFDKHRRSLPPDVEPLELSEEEILAAIRIAADSHSLFGLGKEAVKSLVDGESLPESTELEIESLRDLGGEYLYDVEDVFLSMPVPGSEPVRIPIRQRLLGSRTLRDEIERLNQVIQSAKPLPGVARLVQRRDALIARVKAMSETPGE